MSARRVLARSSASVLVPAIALMVGLAGSITTATAADSAAARAATNSAGVEEGSTFGYRPRLTVEPTYDDLVNLTADTFEFTEAIPQYKATLTDVSSGRRVALGFGWADGDRFSDFEGPFTIDTKAPLPTGRNYESTLRVKTVGTWHCSSRDPDGCSWFPGENNTYRWGFRYDGKTVRGTAPPKQATAVRLSKKVAWGARGWKITATLTRAGAALPDQRLVGQSRTGKQRWVRDGRWRTDGSGRLTILFRGERKPTRYRFDYGGTKFAKPSTSRPFRITSRR